MRAWWQRRAVRHGLFWVAVLAANLLLQVPAHFVIGTPFYVAENVLHLLPVYLLVTYPLLYGVLPRLLQRQGLRFAGLLAAWVVGSSMLANFSNALYELATQPGPPGSLTGGQVGSWFSPLPLSHTFYSLLVTAGGASAIKVMNGWYAQRRLSEQLLRHKLHAELQLLKAQLQPRFLFGALQTLHALTRQQSPASAAAVLHLAALLRYSLYDSQLEAVPLADELEMMRHYVALEQLRPGQPVEVSVSFSGAPGPHCLAPLLLLPFVEQAFQRLARAPHECPWVSLDLVVKAHSLTFKVISSQPATNPGPAPEEDFAAIRRRLARLYPGRHQLKVLPEPDALLVALHLQLAPVPAPLRPTPSQPSLTN